MKFLKNYLFKPILLGLTLTLFGNTGISQVTNSSTNDIPISQYINNKDLYFENLTNSGEDVMELWEYKNYQRELQYFNSLSIDATTTIKDIQTDYNSWIENENWNLNCNTYNVYPNLSFNEVGPYNSTVSNPTQSVIKGTGRINYLTFVPNSQTMFACSEFGGGLFISHNSGQSWENAGTDKGLPINSISSVTVSINSPSTTWYITTGYGSVYNSSSKSPGIGIWRTKNAGLSYERISINNSELNNSTSQRKIICLNGNSGKMRLIVASRNGLFATEDADAIQPIWTKIADGHYYDVEVVPNDQDVIVASGDINTPLIKYDFSSANPSPITVSTMDFNYTLISPDYNGTTTRRATIEFCQDVADKIIVMLTERQSTGGSKTRMYTVGLDYPYTLVYKGLLPDYNGQAGVGLERAMAWAVTPHLTNNKFKVAYANAYAKPRIVEVEFNTTVINSTDWITIDDQQHDTHTHPDFHFMHFNNSGSELFVANDGGVFKFPTSTHPNYNFNDWVDLNTGLGVGTLYDLSTSQNGKRTIVGSFHDMGCIAFNEANNNWLPRSIHYGDGTDDFIDFINSNNIMTAIQYPSVRHSSDNGVSSSTYTNQAGNPIPITSYILSDWQKEFEPNPTESNKLYAGSLNGLQTVIHNDNTQTTTESVLPIEGSITNAIGYNREFVFTQKVCDNPKYSNYIYVLWTGGLSTFDPDKTSTSNGPLLEPDKVKSRIYRSIVGGSTNPNDWELVVDEITTHIGAVNIEVSYDNPNIIWYSVGKKLYKADMTSGTAVITTLDNINLPTASYAGIADICYVNGTNDGIFIANNAGLYYRDNDHNSGNFIRVCDLPNTKVKDVEIDYCRKKIIVATYGRGIWEADLDLPQTKPYTVNSGETITITGDYYAGTNIVIEPNGTLIVEGTLYMPKDSKIDVKPAGNLRVTNGEITNGCDGLWDGISVWGDVNDNTQSYSIQGHASFNNAIIENANVAVRNYGNNTDGSVNWDSRGGIIQASSNTQFLNNRRDVAFQSYQRTWGTGYLANDRSYFRDVEFKTTDEFRHTTTMNHVTMYKTYGIKFTGCDFIDDREDNFNSTWLNSSNAHNCGIRSVDAKYTVQAKCLSGNIFNCTGDLSTNPSGWKATTFTNLDFGIYASNAGTENNITVDRCEFTNNLYGVELVESNSPTVTRSHFIYNNSNKYLNANLNNPDANSPHGYLHGIHALVLSEMRIEENLFINNGAVNNTYGIICSHLGESSEQTYLNRFENLTVASLTQGKNRSVSNNGDYGLQFLCNKNENNIQDHKVLGTLWSDDTAPNYTSNTYGVRSNNGGDNFKSGVEFTQNSASVEDYENFSTNSIKFWHDPSNSNEIPVEITSNVNLGIYLDNDPDACSSNLTSKPIKLLPVLVKSQLISDFNTTSANLVIAKQNYEALLDCGDTDGLMLLIDNLSSNTKSVLRQELLNCSPYVTADIIMATLDKKETEYPNAWCLELILANIDVVRTPNFIQFLTDKTNPMPTWMIQTLNWYVVNGFSLTPKEIKELEIADLSYQRSYASDMIIRDLKNDTTGTNLDSVKFWIEQKADIDSKIRLIDIYLQKNELTMAQTEVNALNADILNYPPHLQTELQDVVTFKTEVISILGNTGGLANMTEANHTFMTNMAINSVGIAKVQAQELLCFFFDECFNYSFDIPMNSRAMMVDKPILTKPELNFKLFPNPASDWVTIELPLDVAPVIVTITNLQGKLILNTKVNRPIYIWETDQLPNGVYLINIKTEVGGYELGTEKVTIQH